MVGLKADPDGTRTRNLLIRSQMPYPLGHGAHELAPIVSPHTNRPHQLTSHRQSYKHTHTHTHKCTIAHQSPLTVPNIPSTLLTNTLTNIVSSPPTIQICNTSMHIYHVHKSAYIYIYIIKYTCEGETMALGILRGQSHQSTESDDPLIRLNKLVYCGRLSETTSSLRNTEIS